MLPGSCLCGAIQLFVKGDLEHDAEACHCHQCRKQTGGYLMGVNVRKSALTIDDERRHLRWYRSSPKVERGFCATCGSTLFWRPDIEGYEWIGVSIAAFDQPTGKTVEKHTFVADKGDYYAIADDKIQHNGF